MNLSDLLSSYTAVLPTRTSPLDHTLNNPGEFLSLAIIKQAKKATKNENPQDSIETEPYSITWTYSADNTDNSSKTPQNNQIKLSNTIRLASSSNRDGFAEFNTAYDSYLKKHPEDNDADMRTILTNIAAHESRYNKNAKNPASSALGYFLMINSTRQANTSVSREEFINNPEELIAAAIRLYKRIEHSYIKPNLNKLQQRGLSKDKAIYGYWFRPVSVLNYLDTGSDSYKDPQGTSLEKVWATYRKLGGILQKN